MDDSLETPRMFPSKTLLNDQQLEEHDQQSSEDEEGGLDWTKLVPSLARPIIPRRGEKEFEPRAGGGTNLQLHVLDRSRQAMFDTLRATRTISSKAVSYAIWHSDISRAQVTVARGIHFSNMGHSAPRSITEDCVTKIQKRLELLPEEAIYLIERGSVFCWKQVDLHIGEIPGRCSVDGSPMAVQQAYSEMIGKEGLNMEKFQVYSYLKRLGYVVTRAHPLDDYYPMAPSLSIAEPRFSVVQKIKKIFSTWVSALSGALVRTFDWWRPSSTCWWFHHKGMYSSLFQSMRFIPAGHNILLNNKVTAESPPTSAYKVFYNVYKPSTPFKKSAPPPPDFQLAVVSARTTPMPTLQELTNLFDIMPESPVPTPRRTQIHTTSTIQISQHLSENNQRSLQSFVGSLFRWFYAAQTPNVPARKPNSFLALKSGKKHVFVAAVDSGNISFFRFGQGEFMEWPMM